MTASVQIAPLLPWGWLAALIVAAVIVVVIGRVRFWPRAVFLGGLVVLLLNPVIVRETRVPLPGKLLVVVDRSVSQKIGGRDVVAENILSSLDKDKTGFEAIVIEAGHDEASRRNRNTSLFAAVHAGAASVPAAEVVGTVIITDGQVHDVPDDAVFIEKFGPVNVVLTGRENEIDRRISIVAAPRYGLVGKDVTMRVMVDDDGTKPGAVVALTVSQDGKPVAERAVRTGEMADFTLPLDHVGQNVFTFTVDGREDELTTVNNTAAAVINGVRDRLHVLLVSGAPHAGERAWRNLLKSDPAIDLVHFTILRPPHTADDTPVRDMALIPFPVAQLFEEKIRDFDLIIFDKYVQYDLLGEVYFNNIADYVRNGGAFLMAMGSDRVERSLFDSALASVLPVMPPADNDLIMKGAYVPSLTSRGMTHPVTADLPRGTWGAWLTQTPVGDVRGEVLMTGAGGKPLLVLGTAGEGRVAVLASDNVWRWSKTGTAGPYTGLLRNVAHWLMREPELEDDFIRTEAGIDNLSIALRGGAGKEMKVDVVTPEGKVETVTLSPAAAGWHAATVDAPVPGLYTLRRGDKTAYAVVGAGAGEELSALKTVADKLSPIVGATGGKTLWRGDEAVVDVKDLRLKRDRAYHVTGVESTRLVPAWLAVFLVIGGLMAVWQREGKG